jgi:hypothetical protein
MWIVEVCFSRIFESIVQVALHLCVCLSLLLGKQQLQEYAVHMHHSGLSAKEARKTKKTLKNCHNGRIFCYRQTCKSKRKALWSFENIYKKVKT